MDSFKILKKQKQKDRNKEVEKYDYLGIKVFTKIMKNIACPRVPNKHTYTRTHTSAWRESETDR